MHDYSDQVVALTAALVRPDIQQMSAYHVPNAAGLIKLDAMESPFPWPGDLQQQWLEKLSTAQINRYPDPQATDVKRRIRQVMTVPDAYSILLGNGSDEVIQLVIQALAREDAVVMSPEPSFVMFKVIANINRVNYVGVSLTKDFALDIDAMLNAIAKHAPAVIFLAQPNNPTGNLYDLQAVEKIIIATPGLVVLDEAYSAFTDRNHVGLLAKYPNVVVMRTVSKVGLAGLRLGLLIAHPGWIEMFDKVRLPYNINLLTQLSAEFAFENYGQLQALADIICQQRKELADQLEQIGRVEIWQSEANFIVFRTLSVNARTVFEKLKEQGVLVKCLDGAHPLLKNCLRVTVSSFEENQYFLTALKAALQSCG